MVQCGTMWYGTVRYNARQCGVTQFDLAQYSLVWFGTVTQCLQAKNNLNEIISDRCSKTKFVFSSCWWLNIVCVRVHVCVHACGMESDRLLPLGCVYYCMYQQIVGLERFQFCFSENLLHSGDIFV